MAGSVPASAVVVAEDCRGPLEAMFEGTEAAPVVVDKT